VRDESEHDGLAELIESYHAGDDNEDGSLPRPRLRTGFTHNQTVSQPRRLRQLLVGALTPQANDAIRDHGLRPG
jgi:hypothetical protein